MREVIPLAERKIDYLFIGFWLLNLVFITYIVDLEQLVIRDPSHFEYPVWPPSALVDLVHWWGTSFDPLQYARPVWWRATIWIDVVLFGPFYATAIYAFVRGRDWLKNPSLVWAGLMFANVTIILFEEFAGPHATRAQATILLANAPWLLMPIATVARMWSPHPFSRAAPEGHDELPRPRAGSARRRS